MKITSSFSLRKRENGIWYLGYEENGKRYWKTTKCTRKSEALQFFKQYTTDTFNPAKTVKLSELIIELENSKTLRKNTILSYSTAVKLFIRHCGDKPVTEYRTNDLETFKHLQVSRKVSDTSINIWIRSIVAMFSFAVKRQYIVKNPFSLSLTIKISKKPPLF